MASHGTLHITPVEGGSWAVTRGEDEPAASIHPSEAQAVASVYEQATAPGETEVIVHDLNGKIYSSLTIRRHALHAEAEEDLDDPALRAEAIRRMPSYARIKAGMGKYPPPPGNFDDEEMPY